MQANSSNAFQQRCVAAAAAVFLFVPVMRSHAQTQSGKAEQRTVPVTGRVLDARGIPVASAHVTVMPSIGATSKEATTDSAGRYQLRALPSGTYSLRAMCVGMQSEPTVVRLPNSSQKPVDLVCGITSASNTALEFSDQPTFTVAGVTDWTAVGGHGSDATLRTSEELNREAAALKARNSDTQETADRDRLAGDLEEKRGNPLAAVGYYQRATQLQPTEANYFAWGTELLLHRAVLEAATVFQTAAKRYPTSTRILAAWGAALFAAARYDEASGKICEASDLDPTARQPYLFAGQIAMATPAASACIRTTLERFLRLHPEDGDANYFAAMLLLKRPSAASTEQAQQLLLHAVALNGKHAEALLQLGILAAARKDYTGAIAYYRDAILADPQMAEAHYRLGVAYDRTGQPEKAKAEYALHAQIHSANAALVEQERRAVKQFSVVSETAPAASTSR